MSAFPPTRHSAVVLIGSDDPTVRARSFDILVRGYWKPVYKHVRMRWQRAADEAQDLTQGFFARAFEKRYFADYNPEKSRFRTYVRTCLDRYVMEGKRNEQRQKRGGDTVKLSLDFDLAERELDTLAPALDAHAYFDREWTRSFMSAAVDALEHVCQQQQKVAYFEVFRRYLIAGDTSYREVAAALELSVNEVTNYLSWTRRAFRRLALEELRQLTASEEEFRLEAKAILGVDVTDASPLERGGRQ